MHPLTLLRVYPKCQLKRIGTTQLQAEIARVHKNIVSRRPVTAEYNSLLSLWLVLGLHTSTPSATTKSSAATRAPPRPARRPPVRRRRRTANQTVTCQWRHAPRNDTGEKRRYEWMVQSPAEVSSHPNRVMVGALQFTRSQECMGVLPHCYFGILLCHEGIRSLIICA